MCLPNPNSFALSISSLFKVRFFPTHLRPLAHFHPLFLFLSLLSLPLSHLSLSTPPVLPCTHSTYNFCPIEGALSEQSRMLKHRVTAAELDAEAGARADQLQGLRALGAGFEATGPLGEQQNWCAGSASVVAPSPPFDLSASHLPSHTHTPAYTCRCPFFSVSSSVGVCFLCDFW